MFLIFTISRTTPVGPNHLGDKYTFRPSKEVFKQRHFDLRIIIITFNRALSLRRLLKSLNKAKYFSDYIKVEVWVDTFKNGTKDDLTIKTAHKFKFKHGSYDVHVRETHAGIYGQWLTSWKPSIVSSV